MVLNDSDLPIVEMDFMNDVHKEDIKIINNLFETILDYEKDSSEKNKELLINKYKSWTEHTIEHFKGEEVEMVKKQFPPYVVHKSEHDRALNTMNNKFQQWIESDDINILKAYLIQEVPQWFKDHIGTMDTITARFLKTGAMMCH